MHMFKTGHLQELTAITRNLQDIIISKILGSLPKQFKYFLISVWESTFAQH